MLNACWPHVTIASVLGSAGLELYLVYGKSTVSLCEIKEEERKGEREGGKEEGRSKALKISKQRNTLLFVSSWKLS